MLVQSDSFKRNNDFQPILACFVFLGKAVGKLKKLYEDSERDVFFENLVTIFKDTNVSFESTIKTLYMYVDARVLSLPVFFEFVHN